MSIEEPRSGSLREETSLGIASRASSFEKSIPRLSKINKTTGNPVVRIIREILLQDEKFFGKLRHLVLISSQGGTESVMCRTNAVSRNYKGAKMRHDVLKEN